MASTTTGIPDWVTRGITETLKPRAAIPGRYPYTYAYDFLRSNASVFGIPEGLSRAEAARLLRDRLGAPDDGSPDPEVEQVCKALADAYLRENNEILP